MHAMLPYPQRSFPIDLGKPDSPHRVIIFHGYTGSPDEFRPLAEKLVATLNAHVLVPLLPGHGTIEDALLDLSYDDFIAFAKETAESLGARERNLIFIGHSFGGHLAIECAAEHGAQALVLTVVPFYLRFPLNIPGLAWIMRRKRLWEKKHPVQEKIERIGLFLYRYMPGIALSILNRGISRSKNDLPKITSPILAINTSEDPLMYTEGSRAMIALAGNHPKSEIEIVESREHGLFYGDGWHHIVDRITVFIEHNIQKESRPV